MVKMTGQGYEVSVVNLETARTVHWESSESLALGDRMIFP